MMKKVSLVALARPTFDVETAQRNFDAARALLKDLGAEVSGPDFLLMTPEDVAKTSISSSDIHILFMASFSDASPAVELLSKVKGPVLLWSTREPGSVGERLKLNSMCGANLAAHALVGAGQSVRHLHGNTEEPETRRKLKEILNGNFPSDVTPPHQSRDLADESVAIAALGKLSQMKIGAVGDAPNGFTPCLFDGEKIKQIFGLEIEKIEIPEAFERISKIPSSKVSTAHSKALVAQPSLAQVNEEQALTVAGVEVALEEWRDQSSLDAIAIRCWPEFPTELGACVCSALGRLSDRGLITTCERDVLGAVTMLLCEALGSDENYLVDIVDLVQEENLIRLWHCGSAATKLASDAENATQYIHCNRKLGVAGNFPLKTGPVTLVRIDRDVDPNNNSGLRMIVSRGESIPAPNHFQGNTATVRTQPDAATLVNGIVTHGYPHHLVISWIDVRPGLRRVAKQLGIPLKEW
jgi:L-fucose isomerase-like protein